MTTSPETAKPPSWRVLAILSTLMGFASISTDLYLPAMPGMGRALHADAGAMEFTITGYLVGFSLGQLLWGPIGDRYGRRIAVAVGIALFVAGSSGCALSDSAAAMIGWRIVQAVGACAGVVLARAMVRDLYHGPRAVQMLSTLITVMAIAPLIGPSLGGEIVTLAGWRWVFWSLVAIGIATLAALFSLPETLPPERRNPQSLGRALLGYADLLRRPRLMGYAAVGGFFYAGAFAYIAGSPLAYIDVYHVPVRLYGVLFGLGIAGIMAVNLVNARLAFRFGADRMLFAGAVAAAVSGIAVATTAHSGWGGLAGLVLPLVAFMSVNGLIVANSIAGALSEFPERTGAASALVGAIQYGSGILGSGLVGGFADGTPWPMGWVIGLCGLGSLLSMTLVRARKGGSAAYCPGE